MRARDPSGRVPPPLRIGGGTGRSQVACRFYGVPSRICNVRWPTVRLANGNWRSLLARRLRGQPGCEGGPCDPPRGARPRSYFVNRRERLVSRPSLGPANLESAARHTWHPLP